ncbi:MAG: redoxin domain-containing protein [Planctomycetales bacterium]|nr:redoxin domain-containing protein [Planctomycetales bacterium]
MSVRTICWSFFCLVLLVTAVSCDQAGTAASHREAAKKPTGSADPPIQRRQPAAEDEPEQALPAHGADPHLRIENGQREESQEENPEPARDVPPAVELPPIFLSDQHQASCLLKQGETMPDVRLSDLEGSEQGLASLLGRKATIVCFWTSASPLATWQLSDLGPDVVEKYASQGVHVIPINYKEPVAKVRAAAEQARLTVPVLLDLEGKLFERVATDYLPRTYVLDAQGRVLWLDIGYSPETQRDLQQAIRYALSLPDG